MAIMDRIVVGGDMSPGATAALRWAVQEAARTGSCVVVVHAFDDHATVPGGDIDRARREERYRTQAWVWEVLASLRTEVPVLISTPDGTVEDALTTAARRASLLVIGEPRHGAHEGLPGVLSHRCACPVMTVPPQPHLTHLARW